MAVLRPRVPPRPSARPSAAASPRNDQDARPLHRRILFPPSSSSSSSFPPPRILHSSAHGVLDPQILDLIALALRAYVSPWYAGAISPDPDKHFLQAVTNVLVHVVQALEVRLAAIDWSALVLHDVPLVLAEHYRDWDLADEKSPSGENGPTSHNLSRDELFDRIHPHLAVHLVPPPGHVAAAAAAASFSSTPAATATAAAAAANPNPNPNLGPLLGARVDPVYLRALTDRLLKLVLPPEDYRSLAERTIVRELVVGVAFRTAFERVAQPWFLHAVIAKQLEPRVAAARAAKEARAHPARTAAGGKVFAALTGVFQGAVSSLGSWLARLTAGAPAAPEAPTAAAASRRPPPCANVHRPLLALASAVLPRSLFLTHLVSLVSVPLFFCARPLAAYLSAAVQGRIARADTASAVLEGIRRAWFPVEGGWPAPREPDPDRNEKDEWRQRAEASLAETLPGAEFRFPFPLRFSVAAKSKRRPGGEVC